MSDYGDVGVFGLATMGANLARNAARHGYKVAVYNRHDERTDHLMGRSPAPRAYLMWYVVPQTYDWLLPAALAFFLQSLAPNKLAGWGYRVFHLIGSLALNKLGWQDPHYRYGAYPGAPLPPDLSGAHGVGWYRLGWGSAAATMIALACMRGPPQPRSVP